MKRVNASLTGALPTHSTMQLGPLTLSNLKQFVKAKLPVCSLPPGKMRSTCMNGFLRFLIHIKGTHTYDCLQEVLLLTGFFFFFFPEMFKCSRDFNDVFWACLSIDEKGEKSHEINPSAVRAGGSAQWYCRSAAWRMSAEPLTHH